MAFPVRRIVLVACAQQKLAHPAKARDLYVSSSFRSSLAYAESLNPDAIFILSAKHELVRLDQELAPYDKTLNGKSPAVVRAWACAVLSQLRSVADLERDTFILLAGERYRRDLVPHLRHAQVPLAGLGIGKQRQFLKRALARPV